MIQRCDGEPAVPTSANLDCHEYSPLLTLIEVASRPIRVFAVVLLSPTSLATSLAWHHLYQVLLDSDYGIPSMAATLIRWILDTFLSAAEEEREQTGSQTPS
jgi:hypothetical protein